MSIFDSLQTMLGGERDAGVATGSGGGLGGFITSGGLGPLAKSVLTNKNGDFSWLKGALLAGAGSMLWKKLTERVGQTNAAVDPEYGKVQSPPEMQAERVIRALVYAAKSDGHIDAAEQAAINSRIRSLNLGNEAETIVRQAMDEPLDPNVIAKGIKDPQEALQLYTLSSAIIDPDQFMEKAYLDGLARALGIPPDVRSQVDRQVQSQRAKV